MYLEKMGARVTLAENGKIAVEKAMQFEFDLILMDVQMPIMDGLEAVKLLRIGKYNNPIVALTANAMQQDREKCMAAGCDEFISKPVHRNDLYRSVSRYLRIVDKDEKKYPPITSTLATDEPELMDIVYRFVDNLPNSVNKIIDATEKRNWDEVKNISHQLKGVGGGYGYPMLTELSAKIQFQLESNFYEEVVVLIDELEKMSQQIYLGLYPEKGEENDKSSVG